MSATSAATAEMGDPTLWCAGVAVAGANVTNEGLVPGIFGLVTVK